MSATGQLVRKDDPDIQIDAVLEVLPAQALIARASLDARGSVELVYFGETKVDWNAQRTLCGPNGRLFVDQHGAVVPETEVVIRTHDGQIHSPRHLGSGLATEAGSIMEALRHAVNGKRVRRAAWAPETYLHFSVSDGFVISDLAEPGSVSAYCPQRRDVDAGDWEVLADEPPHSPDTPPSTFGVAEAAALPVRAVSGGRLAERAWGDGFGTLDAREALELYISRTWPKAAATLATLLLERFADLQHVLGATVDEIAQVVGHELALELKLLHNVGARLLMFPIARRTVLSSWSTLLEYLRLQMAGSRTEMFRVLFLDSRNQLIADEVMNRGTVAHAPVYPRKIVKRALELSANAVILSHPHPSGDPTPSSADIAMTKQVIEACRPLGVGVYDHVIVGGDSTVSMKALGLI